MNSVSRRGSISTAACAMLAALLICAWVGPPLAFGAPPQSARTPFLTQPSTAYLPMATATQDGFTYEVLAGNTVRIVSAPPDATYVPDTLGGYPVSAIGDSAFDGVTALTSANLPATLRELGSGAFANIPSLTSVTLNADLDSADWPFTGCDSLTHFTFGPSVTIVPDSFCAQTGVTTVTWPSTIATIGTDAFGYCASLTSITLPSKLSSIGDYAFEGSGLTSLPAFPAGITKLPDGCFQGCGSLASVTVPSSIKSLGWGAFSSCANLTSVTLNADLDSSNWAFSGCDSLTHFTFASGVKAVPDSFCAETGVTTVTWPSTITTIGTDAFSYCPSLTSITLPANLKSMGNYAFESSGLTSLPTFPAGITELPDGCFQSCNSLTSVTLPSSIKSLRSGVFASCSGVTNVTLNADLDSSDWPFTGCDSLTHFTFAHGVTTVPQGFCAETGVTSVTWPSTITGIANGGFSYCASLTSITLPPTLTSIGDYAFESAGLTNLPVLTSAHTTIGIGAFQACSGLTSITIPATVDLIGSNAFDGCAGLTQVTIMGGTAASDQVFGDCPNLTHFVVAEGVTRLGDFIFAGSSVDSVEWPSTITSIGRGVFEGCEHLTALNVPDTVTSIGDAAFYGCTALTNAVLPSKLTTLGTDAFGYSPHLESIAAPDSLVDIGDEYYFSHIPELVIMADIDAPIVRWAIDNRLQVRPLSTAIADKPAMVLDRPDTHYLETSAGNRGAGYAAYRVTYALKQSAQPSVSGMSVVIRLPKDAEVIEDSLVVNGEVQTGVTASYELSVPVTEPTGTIEFSVSGRDEGMTNTYAELAFQQNGADKRELIDVVLGDARLLTLDNNPSTTEANFDVSGVALPGTAVKVLVDGVQSAQTVATLSGSYRATVTLAQPKNFKRYALEARSVTSTGAPIAAQSSIVYRTGGPRFLSMTMETNNQTWTKLPDSTLNPLLLFKPGATFKFSVSLDNTADVDSVWVRSERGGALRDLDLVWDPATSAYTGEGLFDPDNPNYVPGELSVCYASKPQPYDVHALVDFTSDQYANPVSDQWRTAAVALRTNTATALDATLTLGTPDQPKIRVRASSASIGSGVTSSSLVAAGYLPIPVQRPAGATPSSVYARSQYVGGEVVFDLADPVTGKTQTWQFEQPSQGLPAGTDGDVFRYLDNPMAAIETAGGKLQVSDAQAQILSNASLTDADRNTGLAQVHEAAIWGGTRSALRATGVALAEAHVNGLDPGEAMTAATAGAEIILDRPAGSAAVTPASVRPMRGTPAGDMCDGFVDHWLHKMGASWWCIDPSGYVYDAKTNARLQGVKVTAYYRATANDTPVIWDSTNYGQMNPLHTDVEGRYAWDVPEGQWQVKAELAGYETTVSAWLDVPPPQTDVNLGMTPIQDSVTAVIDVVAPNPATQGAAVSFSGHGIDSLGHAMAGCEWKSSLDGVLSASGSFTRSDLSVGTHTITYRVRCTSGAWSAPVTTSLVVVSAPTSVVAAPKPTSLSTLSLSGSPKKKHKVTFSTIITPADARGDAGTKLTLSHYETKTVTKKVKGKKKKVKVFYWKVRATIPMSASTSGKLTAVYTPALSGKWSAVAAYGGSPRYLASATGLKTFTVK